MRSRYESFFFLKKIDGMISIELRVNGCIDLRIKLDLPSSCMVRQTLDLFFYKHSSDRIGHIYTPSYNTMRSKICKTT